MEVRWQDMLEDLKELKHDKYVIVLQHKDSSLRCACWQGLIYLKDTDGTDVTLKNWHEWNNTENHITPKQKGTLPDGQPYYSLREAMECGLFSYNCRHRLIKYEAGVKVPKQYAYNPNEESKSALIDQHMRQMEQNIRRAKERQTLALSAKERAKWQEKSKALQKKYDEFCKKNNRVRNDWRTVIGRQERRGMKAVEQAFDEAYIDPKASAKEAGIVRSKINKENQKEKEQRIKALKDAQEQKEIREQFNEFAKQNPDCLNPNTQKSVSNQNKHFKGTKEYQDCIKANLLKSVFDEKKITREQLNDYVLKNIDKIKWERYSKTRGFKGYLEFENDIAYNLDEETKKYESTNRIKVHFSKSGFHSVQSRKVRKKK